MPVYRPETLEEANAGDKPARLAVIGHPVGHSASPRMHQPALDEAGIDASYIAVEVDPGTVAQTFARMRELGFIGCNVTVPHKFEALAACDEIEDAARELGAVNTVRFDDDAIRGTNTDGYGFEQAIREDLEFELSDAAVFIAGAGGGAGGAIATHCACSGVARIVLSNRTISKIEELATKIRRLHPDVDLITCGADAPAEVLQELTGSCSLLVNTSSLGLKADDPSPLPAGCFFPRHAVFDSIYQPPRTSFLIAAEQAGARTANGKGMLLHQGVAAFRYWFPGTDPTEAMRAGLG
ncbi:shikimate 5-dehydrogenase [Haloferula helveola]|uniref:Shikimate dehydrogenase (NADP(+)) n=1 Tax=Haloferula helveola TaxID=490095 RepID=A0ABN6H7J4_9BACT|nr:shikimate 5-dehydrogenase [Haloferula helveola]